MTWGSVADGLDEVTTLIRCPLVLVLSVVSGRNTCCLIASLDLRHSKNSAPTTMSLFHGINIHEHPNPDLQNDTVFLISKLGRKGTLPAFQS